MSKNQKYMKKEHFLWSIISQERVIVNINK
jgi:hypothetical protein